MERVLGRAVPVLLRGAARCFYRVRVRGEVPAAGGAVFVCNHVSYADTLPLALASRRRFRFTSFEGLFAVPLLGPLLRAAGSIPVSPAQPREVIRRAAACAAAGEGVLIFPEGQLTLDGRAQAIKGGYELIARRAGVPIVMVHLDGLWGSVFSFAGGRFFFKWPRRWRRDITVTFSPPHPAAEASAERLATFWAEAERRAKVSPPTRRAATLAA